MPPPTPQNAGSQRLLAAAASGELHDRCLWTPIAAATGARGNTTALVGTPETVAEAMADYYKIGVNTILIRGFDPLNDAIQYGAELLPLVREKVAAFDAAAAEPVPVRRRPLTDVRNVPTPAWGWGPIRSCRLRKLLGARPSRRPGYSSLG